MKKRNPDFVCPKCESENVSMLTLHEGNSDEMQCDDCWERGSIFDFKKAANEHNNRFTADSRGAR